uniref:Uncharacterized protein n=1 Tax=Anguilla anguilla TaxID=7936 RepID=A0A0E9XEX4_ANGAN
MRLAVPGM